MAALVEQAEVVLVKAVVLLVMQGLLTQVVVGVVALEAQVQMAAQAAQASSS
jgi:hypothetical protein